MKLSPMNIKDATRHLLREKPVRDKFDAFKINLIDLLDKLKELENLPKQESEEHLKNDIRDFLLNTYYKGRNVVNTNYKKDLVIYLDNSVNSNVGVVIEAKRPISMEMVSLENANKKAMHESILYYMDERMKESPNNEIKKLIITNINEWYIIDANEFDKHIYPDFKKLYELTKKDKKDNEFFYEEARKKLETITYEMPCVKFDLTEYRDKLKSKSKNAEVDLVALYKIFSPNFLLKERVVNDSNSLDPQFYIELLDIIGLAETDDAGKKVIQRKKVDARNSGSILEDTILQLDSLDKISRLEKPDLFGSTYQERLFNVALELCITWINRILFLKLLESQIISYQNPELTLHPFQFLNSTKIRSYDDLNGLFFQVLAKKHNDRSPEMKKAFEKVPYLNSSLFEPTEIEHATLFISNLQGNKQIPVSSNTKILNEVGKKQTGNLNTLDYLFKFLNAYDFSTDSGEEVQEVNRTLMNASVLGLIFEKINGYKDGAVFTPSFVTMYMCRETIRRTVVQKFNEVKKWNCKTFEELKVWIQYRDNEVRKEANKIINSIKLCDPSVGSGHYLVSALNEILSIKYDLNIMQFHTTHELILDHSFTVMDDELIVTNLDSGNRFKYNPINPKSQRIQETLFHEKQTIIENCLFGVDINPNSVKICRLRLWIELLKNAYYKTPTELETLPNIDINIKCGNSLVSRFSIDADLSQALKKSKYSIDSYRDAVDTYRNATSKEEKREMERLITLIKTDFKSEISKNDPKVKKLYKLSGELLFLTNQTSLFEKTKKEKADWNKKVKQLTDEIEKLENEIEEIKGNKIYENAFEWRFEFPEVLNEKGDFVGFDIVIGNPPYIKEDANKDAFNGQKGKECYQGKMDLWYLFGDLGLKLLKKDYFLCFIATNNWVTNAGASNFRNIIIQQARIFTLIDFGAYMIFENASIQTMIMLFQNNNDYDNYNFDYRRLEGDKNFKEEVANLLIGLNNKQITILNPLIVRNEKINNLLTFSSDNKSRILDKLKIKQNFFLRDKSNKELGFKSEVASGIDVLQDFVSKDNSLKLNGIAKAGDGVFVLNHHELEDLKLSDLENEIIKPYFTTEQLGKYYGNPKNKLWIVYTKSDIGKYNELTKITPIDKYPNIKKHLDKYKPIITSDNKPYGLHRTREQYLFEGVKIFALRKCTNNPQFTYSEFDCFVSRAFMVIKSGRINLKFLTGLLNSRLIEFWLRYKGKMQGNSYQIDKDPLIEIPIFKPLDTEQQPIIDLVDKIISAKKLNESTVDLEAEIDEMVYKLYDLTGEEIEIIKGVSK